MSTIYVQDKSNLAKRRKFDNYPTEVTLARRAVAEGLRFWYPHRREIGVLDVGAGTGVWGQACLAELPKGQVDVGYLHGIDLRDLPCPAGFDGWSPKRDFLTFPIYGYYDLIVSNPPYYIAEQCIRKSWKYLNFGGMMIFLLRLSFMAGVGRHKGLWQDIPVSHVGVVSRRPSFYGRGTNATDYGVYYFMKNMDGTPHGVHRSWNTFLLLHERDWRSDTEPVETARESSG